MLDDFHKGDLPVERLNYGTISTVTLLHKRRIRKWRLWLRLSLLTKLTAAKHCSCNTVPNTVDILQQLIQPVLPISDGSYRHNVTTLCCESVTLLPKSSDANKIRNYRPICLLNVCYSNFHQITKGYNDWGCRQCYFRSSNSLYEREIYHGGCINLGEISLVTSYKVEIREMTS